MSKVPLCRLKNVVEGFRTYLHCAVQCGDTYANFKQVSEATSHQTVLHNENEVLMSREFFMKAFLKSNLRSIKLYLRSPHSKSKCPSAGHGELHGSFTLPHLPFQMISVTDN